MAYTFDDSIRRHDEAVANWLRTLRVDYNRAGGLFATDQNNVPIIAVFGTPDRAVAEVKETLVRLDWVAGGSNAEKRAKVESLDVLPTPFVSFYRGEPVMEPAMAGVPKHLRGLSGEIHPYPGIYLTDYTLSFFSQRRFTDNHIRAWVYGQLGKLGCVYDEIQLPVAHPSPWGTKEQSFRLVSSADLSENEGAEPRYIRTEFVFSLRTWILKNTVDSWGQQP